MTERLKELFGLVQYAHTLVAAGNKVTFGEINLAFPRQLSRAETLHKSNELFLRDMEEKFLEEKYGIEMGSSCVQIRKQCGKLSAPMRVSMAKINFDKGVPATFSSATPLEVAFFGTQYCPGHPDHCRSAYQRLEETSGDTLVVLSQADMGLKLVA